MAPSPLTPFSQAHQPERPVFLSRQELQEIHTRLALLDNKLDLILQDRKRVDDLEEEVGELKLFAAQVKTWGIVGGGIWSLLLTLISMRLWGG